jgi:benzoate 4-monooxygenase
VQDLYGSLTIEPIRWHLGWLNKFSAILPWKQWREAEKCSVRAFKRASGLVADYKKRHGNDDPDEM